MGLLSWLLFGRQKPPPKPAEDRPEQQFARERHHRSRHPIPKGHRVFIRDLTATYHSSNREAQLAFCRGRDQSLRIEPEPDNPVDANALRLIGEWTEWGGRQRQMVGYVDAKTARAIATAGVARSVSARLTGTVLGDAGYVAIEYQITGPKGDFDRLQALP